MNRQNFKSVWVALAITIGLCAVASACPTCKDNMAHDPASANLVRGYAYSIMFMLSMPPLIFSSLCAYFYWEVRKAKARAARISAESGPVAAPQS
jgi:heme/copper-type cytochrome/quinol oxidase subunit 2